MTDLKNSAASNCEHDRSGALDEFVERVKAAVAATWMNLSEGHRALLVRCLNKSSLTEGDLAVLYEFTRRQRPRSVIEVGLATGSSAVCHLLSAGQTIESYTAIDPFQSSNFKNLGINFVREVAGDDVSIDLVEKPSYVALS